MALVRGILMIPRQLFNNITKLYCHTVNGLAEYSERGQSRDIIYIEVSLLLRPEEVIKYILWHS